MNTVKAYINLTKPSINSLILVTTALGFYLGGRGIHNWSLLIYTLLGAGLTCAGAAVLNNYLERDTDRLMERTKNRPLPTGQIKANNALSFGVLLVLVGIFILYVQANILTAFLSLLTAFLYVLVYTPLKKVSWLNTTIGAIPGAIPPLGGWAAATGGHLEFGAGVLFMILFLWQHPHFYAIAWLCRDQYKKAGFQMLPFAGPGEATMFRKIGVLTLGMIPVSLIPSWIGLSGAVYFWGTLMAGVLLSFIALQFIRSHDNQHAVALLKASVFYLPILLILIIVDVSF